MSEDVLIAKLNLIASEIKHEDDLIGQRTTWLARLLMAQHQRLEEAPRQGQSMAEMGTLLRTESGARKDGRQTP